MKRVAIPDSDDDREEEEEEDRVPAEFKLRKTAPSTSTAQPPEPPPPPTVSTGADQPSTSSANAKPAGLGLRSGVGTPVLVNPRQKGNPLLKFLRNVRYEFHTGLKGDYDVGGGATVVFLSLKFHKRSGEYIHSRFKEVGRSYALQILLVLEDVEEPGQSVKELSRMALLSGFSLILAHSYEEAAEYIELYKMVENKSVNALKGTDGVGKKDVKTVDLSSLRDPEKAAAVKILTAIRSVNRSDAVRLLEIFGSIKAISEKTEDELSICPGIAGSKAKKIVEIFHLPFPT